MKSNYFSNKVVLISGSSMGIGKAIARELAQQGVKVILNGRNSIKLQRSETEFLDMGYEVFGVVADIRYPEQCDFLIREAVNRYGRLDILVNNAAMSSRGSIEHSADKNFSVLSETNYTGAAHLSKYAIPHLKETKGHIIFINSAGGFRGMPYNVAYSASKLAQAALADALRIELYGYGIHVGIAFVGFTRNDPKKTILDVNGSLVYLPKRDNIHLASPQSVAKHIGSMIVRRKNKITLTGLGRFANFTFRYLPWLGNWLLIRTRKKIQKDFTLIGGVPVLEEVPIHE